MLAGADAHLAGRHEQFVDVTVAVVVLAVTDLVGRRARGRRAVHTARAGPRGATGTRCTSVRTCFTPTPHGTIGHRATRGGRIWRSVGRGDQGRADVGTAGQSEAARSEEGDDCMFHDSIVSLRSVLGNSLGTPQAGRTTV